MSAEAFVFRGHFERHGPDVWAVCDHAPVFASGETEDAALSRIEHALAAYLRMLSDHGEIDAAMAAGILVSSRLKRIRPPGGATRRVKGDQFEALLAWAA